QPYLVQPEPLLPLRPRSRGGFGGLALSSPLLDGSLALRLALLPCRLLPLDNSTRIEADKQGHNLALVRTPRLEVPATNPDVVPVLLPQDIGRSDRGRPVLVVSNPEVLLGCDGLRLDDVLHLLQVRLEHRGPVAPAPSARSLGRNLRAMPAHPVLHLPNLLWHHDSFSCL